jgi:alpha-beta hydrolase superfamily lysophospholipase
MKRIIGLMLTALALLGVFSCFDLDTFITPVVFKPTPMSAPLRQAAPDTDLGAHINPLYDDSLISNLATSLISFPSGGATLYGYLLQHAVPSTGLILFCHGNVKNIDHFWPRCKLLYQTGMDVLVFDYRGFGMSGGSCSEANLLEDAMAALDYAVSIGYTRTDMVVYGYSLGSVPAVHAAVNGSLGGSSRLILEAPIASTDVYVQDATGLPIPGSYLTGYRLDNITNIRKWTLPLLWIGGTADQTNKYDTHGQAVFDNCPSPDKYKKIVAGATHGDAPYVMDPGFSQYISGVSNFINGIYPPF